MILAKKDCEDWTSKNFLYYVIHKLSEKGIIRKPVFPQDMMIVGSIVRNCKTSGKTNAFIKNRLDEKFEEFKMTKVQSLVFLTTFFPDIAFTFKKNHSIKSKEITLTNKTLDTLRQLKRDVKTPSTSEPV